MIVMGATAAWTYDAVGSCLTDIGSGVTNSAAYDVDNELLFWSTMSATQNTIRGQVAPGPQQLKCLVQLRRFCQVPRRHVGSRIGWQNAPMGGTCHAAVWALTKGTSA